MPSISAWLVRAPVRLTEVVEEACGLYADLAEEKGITLEARVGEGLVLFADRSRLRQVLANLLDNAIKYTPAGGRVDVTGHAEGEEAVLTVRDTGSGIPVSDLPRVWERLYRSDASRSERGLGLGLSLVKAVVEAHGGRVAVSSVLSRGSVFTVTLPTVSPGWIDRSGRIELRTATATGAVAAAQSCRTTQVRASATLPWRRSWRPAAPRRSPHGRSSRHRPSSTGRWHAVLPRP